MAIADSILMPNITNFILHKVQSSAKLINFKVKRSLILLPRAGKTQYNVSVSL